MANHTFQKMTREELKATRGVILYAITIRGKALIEVVYRTEAEATCMLSEYPGGKIQEICIPPSCIPPSFMPPRY